jgi:hypothetical protein
MNVLELDGSILLLSPRNDNPVTPVPVGLGDCVGEKVIFVGVLFVIHILGLFTVTIDVDPKFSGVVARFIFTFVFVGICELVGGIIVISESTFGEMSLKVPGVDEG